MMSGWLRHFVLSAQARTGFSTHVLVWSVIAAVAATAAFIFLCIAAFLWLADRYDPIIAGVLLGFFFVLVALLALLVGLLVRRRNMERARLELAARSQASWLDPKLMGVGFQVGQAIGWRRLASLAAVALLAAGLAKEWFARDGAESAGEGEPPPES
jgi:O-antigen/teichoic acid export membrane protein